MRNNYDFSNAERGKHRHTEVERRAVDPIIEAKRRLGLCITQGCNALRARSGCDLCEQCIETGART